MTRPLPAGESAGPTGIGFAVWMAQGARSQQPPSELLSDAQRAALNHASRAREELSWFKTADYVAQDRERVAQAVTATRARFASREAVTSDDVAEALQRVGRFSAPRMLFDLHAHGWVTVPELRQHLVSTWVFSSWTTAHLSNNEWLTLFRASGYVNENGRAPAPVEPIRLYRGAGAEYVSNLSWTGSRAVAEHYAKAAWGRPAGAVWSVVVPPDRLHGHCGWGSHDEHIADVRGLQIERVSGDVA